MVPATRRTRGSRTCSRASRVDRVGDERPDRPATGRIAVRAGDCRAVRGRCRHLRWCRAGDVVHDWQLSAGCGCCCRSATDRRCRASLAEGIRWLWNNRCRALAVVSTALGTASFIGNAVFVIFATDTLGLSESGYGICWSPVRSADRRFAARSSVPPLSAATNTADLGGRFRGGHLADGGDVVAILVGALSRALARCGDGVERTHIGPAPRADPRRDAWACRRQLPLPRLLGHAVRSVGRWPVGQRVRVRSAIFVSGSILVFVGVEPADGVAVVERQGSPLDPNGDRRSSSAMTSTPISMIPMRRWRSYRSRPALGQAAVALDLADGEHAVRGLGADLLRGCAVIGSMRLSGSCVVMRRRRCWRISWPGGVRRGVRGEAGEFGRCLIRWFGGLGRGPVRRGMGMPLARSRWPGRSGLVPAVNL